MESLVGVKIGSLLALLVLTLLCGIIPVRFKWFQIHAATGKHRRVLSFLNCISAGVFLGAGLMHMTAEALENIESEIQSYFLQNGTGNEGNSSDTTDSTDVDYPFGELIISLGFFLVYLLESLALQWCPGGTRGSKSQEELGGTHDAHSFSLHSHGLPPSAAQGSFRALVLLISLSFHSVFEGLAVGLQSSIPAVLQLCLAVLAHKGLVVFGVGLQLVQTGTGPRWALISILTFALMSPLGVAVGMAVVGEDPEGGRALAQAVLEGVAAGTFLFVTFLEILPRQLASPESPLAKWFCMAAGFAFMAVIAIWA